MRIAICDDEKQIRSNIIDLIKPHFSNNNDREIYEFYCGEELLNDYNSGKRFDILFLDVEMQEKNGIETAKEIRKTDDNIIIIFITSHIDYVFDTFRVNAFQFLKKPIDKEIFDNDFERALNYYKKNHFKYEIRYKNEINIVDIKDIAFIEVFNHSVYIHCNLIKYQKFGKLKDEITSLEQFGFVQCHKSILVNMSHIKNVGENTLTLKNNTSLIISKNYKKVLIETFNKYLSECCV